MYEQFRELYRVAGQGTGVATTILSLFVCALSPDVLAYSDSPPANLSSSIVRSPALNAKNNLAVKEAAAEALSSGGVVAEEPSVPSTDILNRLNISPELTAETTDLLGDRIDLNSGTLSFSHRDVSVQGNGGLEVAIWRTWHSADFSWRQTLDFEDWKLEMPSIQTTLLSNDVHTQSNVRFSGAWGEGKACSGALDPIAYSHNGSIHDSFEFWNGDTLTIPGQITEKLLEAPSGAGRAIKSNWRITCIPAGNGGQEGFVVESPDGTKYTLDKLIILRDRIVSKDRVMLWKNHAFMQATKIEDRFGNWVKYSYSENRLSSISSSDGRLISLEYDAGENSHRIARISANGRTWLYEYTNNRLTKVVRPDGRSWQFSLFGLNVQPYPESPNQGMCTFHQFASGEGWVKHPDGVRGTFTLAQVVHGRTEVPMRTEVKGESIVSFWPKCFSSMAITGKQISEAGLPSLSWTYLYSGKHGAFIGEQKPAIPNIAVPYGYDAGDIKTTTVLAPDGSRTVHYFNRRFSYLDGQKVAVDHFDTDGATRLRREEWLFGRGLQHGNSWFSYENTEMHEFSVNLLEHRTVDGVDSYVRKNSVFNAYGVPELIEESNTVNGLVRKTRLTHKHDTANWLLNLPEKTEVSDGGAWTEVSRTEYHAPTHAAKSLPWKTYRYGALQKTFSYHADGNLSRVDYNLPGVWQEFSSYKRGKPQILKMPSRTGSGTVSAQMPVNDDGTVASVTDFNGHTTRYEYDSMLRVTRVDPADARWDDTTLAYETLSGGEEGQVAGQFKQTLTRGNYEKTTWFDGLLRPVQVRERDVSGATPARYTRQSWNAYNKPTFASRPAASAAAATSGTSTLYDGLQRVKSVTDGSGSTVTTYLAGNKVAVQNPRGHTTTTTYLAYGSPETAQPLKIESPESVTTELSYNVFGDLLSITQGGHTETRLYDSHHHLCKIIRPEFGQRLIQNNALGMAEWYAEGRGGSPTSCETSTTDGKVTLAYDNWGDLLSEDYQDSTPDRLYTRDAQGNLTGLRTGTLSGGSISAPLTSWSYLYNSAHLPETQTLSVAQGPGLSDKTFTLGYTWNRAGQLSAQSYPDTSSVDYAPNVFGQPTRAGSYASNALYHPNGMLESFSYGNGARFSQTLDSEQRPDVLSHVVGGQTKIGLNHDYDANDNLERITVSGVSSYTQTNVFDALDRLKGVTGAGSNSADHVIDFRFAYDVRNNLTDQSEDIRSKQSQQIVSAKNYSYTIDAARNRLASVSGSSSASFAYDIRGNVTSNGRQTLSYGLDNRLASASGGGVSASFTYDGHGRLVKKVNNGSTSYSVYAPDGTLLYQVDSDGTSTRYVRLGKQPVAEVRKSP